MLHPDPQEIEAEMNNGKWLPFGATPTEAKIAAIKRRIEAKLTKEERELLKREL